ncbi:MAG TPA: hypothetical protein VGG20_10420 [Thermoanaerobaculia bacterium]|jgi:hypothetical protein
MPSTPHPARHASLYILLGLLLLSAILVPVIAFRYAYDMSSWIAGGGGFALLLAAFGGTWLITRTARRDAAPAALDRITLSGLVLGLLWTIEIGINNFVAPPLPGRDTADDSFWALIALGILIASVVAAYSLGRFKAGLAVGTWSGLASGAVACVTALALIIFGMPLLLSDPVNLTEWANRAKDSTAPTMASYFAFETMAGAFLHLVALGVGMGFVLGAVGGALGTAAKLGPSRLRHRPSGLQKG